MATINVDRREFDKRIMQDFANHNWLVKKLKNNKNKSSTTYNDVVPPLKLIRPNHSSVTKRNNSSKLEQYQQNLDKAIGEYNTIKEAQQAPIRSHLPVPPPPERIKYIHRTREDAPIISQTVSVGTNTDLTLTKDDMEIFAFFKNAGVHMDDVKKVVNDRKDNNNNENLSTQPQEEKRDNHADRASLENIREALFESSNNNKKELLPFLTYLSVDNHDCESSVLCLPENKRNKSSSNGETYQCIFKTLKDTLKPGNFQKVRSHLQDHIFGGANKNGVRDTRNKIVTNKCSKHTSKHQVENRKNANVAAQEKTVHANADKQQSQNNVVNETPANLNAVETFVPTEAGQNMTQALPATTNFPANQHLLYETSKLKDPRNKPILMNPTQQQGVPPVVYMQQPMPPVWIPHQAGAVPYPIPNQGYHPGQEYHRNNYNHRNIAYPNACWNNSVFMN